MRALAGAECLQVWETAARLHPLDRGLAALKMALPETPYESLADWPLGQRNQALAQLRCARFGTDLEAWVVCPACGERLEFRMDARVLTETVPSGPPPPISFNGLLFRLPTSRDLARTVREPDPHAGAMCLIEACRLDPTQTPDSPWSEQAVDELGAQMALADPMAETRLALNCAACANQWDETLDIGAYLWTEIEVLAKRLLADVHTLASAYGWSEHDILALSEARRSFYLEMVQA